MPHITEAGYLGELAARARAVLGAELVGVYAGGSWALGDYLPGRSDLDVAVVCGRALGDAAIDALVAALRHEALPCPARGLELVVYTRAVAGAGSVEPGFELNLNSGAAMAARVDRRGATPEAHWFAIDRSLLAAHGRALAGPPAGEVFRSAPRAAILRLLADSRRWHEDGGAALDDAVLNAARSIHYARAGRWTSKSRAARRLRERGDHAELVAAALATRDRDREAALDPQAVRGFLRYAAEVVATGKEGAA